jgi:hypothetical protein
MFTSGASAGFRPVSQGSSSGAAPLPPDKNTWPDTGIAISFRASGRYTGPRSISRQLGERKMQGTFEYSLDSNGDALALGIDLDSVSAKALARLDRYINWADVLKLTENDPEAANAAERLHTVLQHLSR